MTKYLSLGLTLLNARSSYFLFFLLYERLYWRRLIEALKRIETVELRKVFRLYFSRIMNMDNNLHCYKYLIRNIYLKASWYWKFIFSKVPKTSKYWWTNIKIFWKVWWKCWISRHIRIEDKKTSILYIREFTKIKVVGSEVNVHKHTHFKFI